MKNTGDSGLGIGDSGSACGCCGFGIRAALAFAMAAGLVASAFAGQGGGATTNAFTPRRTPWGHPDIQGIYTNKDEANTPLERPGNLQSRDAREFDETALANLVKERQAQARKIAPGIGGSETGAGPTHWYEHLEAKGSRPWFIVDPPDGRLPAFTPQAERREAAYAALNNARNGEGRADSTDDRSLYDRCITRGLPASMMPAIYGNAYQILQTPDFVAIRYEMIHETRIIPIDGRPHVGPNVHLYMGDARGRWDGNTLVVETTNFTDRTHMGNNNRYNSERLKIVERFTPVRPDRLAWEVTITDTDTWTRPWTFAMPLTRDDTQQVFEYACHEGNRGLLHIFTGARADDAKGHR
ncbi:MAG: hypothetical protein ACRD1Q_16685 [Vicinamibacterales bacterium]